MRKLTFVMMILVLALSFSLPALADAPNKDDIKLRVFVHYPARGKPAPQPGTCDQSASTTPASYGLTGWKLPGPVTYYVNSDTVPASVSNVAGAIANSFATWQSASGIAFTKGGSTAARGAKRDGQNVVIWGSVPSGAIAVTYTWSRDSVVVEVDTVMSKSLAWAYTPTSSADTSCSSNMYAYDVQDILTHELGHWMGLDDLYDPSDHDLTMYGYGDKGELKKDTLGTGDLKGIQALY